MQTATRNERYRKAVESRGLCEGLSRKLRILAGDPDSLSGQAMEGWDRSFAGLAASLERMKEES